MPGLYRISGTQQVPLPGDPVGLAVRVEPDLPHVLQELGLGPHRVGVEQPPQVGQAGGDEGAEGPLGEPRGGGPGEP